MSHPTARELLGHRLSGATRVVTLIDCTVCETPVWVGWDEDFAAMPGVADVTPIDGVTEVAMWLAGRHTYVLSSLPGGKRLSVRSEAMTEKGAGGKPHRVSPILPEHCCEEWL